LRDAGFGSGSRNALEGSRLHCHRPS
jgi:hypothetical protein